MATLKELIARRTIIKGHLTRFINFIESFNPEQVSELKPRIERIENCWKEFDEVQTSIELIDTKESELETREVFENKYFKYIAKAKEIIFTYTTKTEETSKTNLNQASAISHENDDNNLELELQKFVLPKFQGEYDKWFKFKNTFDSLIVKNPKFDNAQKFYRLQECVIGEAEKVIDGIEDFKIAWNLLIERFEDKPGMVQKHLKELIDLPNVKFASASGLRKLLDEINRHLRALKSLDEPIDSWSSMLIVLMSRKLDDKSRDSWEQARIVKFKGIPTFSEFLGFILERCKSLEARISEPSTNCMPKELWVPNRKEQATKLKLCLNCLRKSHLVNDCRSSGCKKCHGRHNTLLHEETLVTSTPVGVRNNASDVSTHLIIENRNITTESNITDSVNLHCNSKLNSSCILLSTAIILISDKYGQFHKARCLLDNGSQPSFITQELFRKLGLPAESVSLPIVGVNQVQCQISARTIATIKSVSSNFNAKISLLILNKITTNIPAKSINPVNLKLPENVKLADPQFFVSDKIDILLGAQLFLDLLCVGQIKLGPGLPTLQKTLLGWIIAGPFQDSVESKGLTCNLVVSDDNLNEKLEQFWKIEELESFQIYSKEESDCENHFVENYFRNESGRFVVSLPIKENIVNLGDSLKIAKSRLYSVERKFAKNPKLKESYITFMREYLRLGHMTQLNTSDIIEPNQRVYYLPHHGVINETSLTTKLRVVFDGTAKPSSGLALNEVLKVGPHIQDDLFSILCRFRSHKFVITSDIGKMYRMIEINENQRDLQRIVWREDSNTEIKHFRLNTVTYGTGPASFLSTRCLKQISEDILPNDPKLSQIISNDFYIDDLITGANSSKEVLIIAHDISKILSRYGFNLRKWNSNSSEVLKELSECEIVSTEHFLTSNDCSKTLGVFWCPQKGDNLEYMINIPNVNKVTKRSILSIIAGIFDPLGLIGHVIITAKIFLQQIWKLKIEWDESLPLDIYSSWMEFKAQLPLLNNIKIPRSLSSINGILFELHGFSDASEKASGACIYFKAINEQNQVSVRLLCSKSRVAPLKTISLPRMELCGALLLATLMNKVLKSFNIENLSTFYWCDSTIVLAWLRDEPNSWKTFVANRVSKIQNLSDRNKWSHVKSSENPADIISRGTMPTTLANLRLWWDGPEFLYSTNIKCTSEITKLQNDSIPERKRVKPMCLISSELDSSHIINRYSNLRKLLNVTAWIYRFINNTRHLKNNKNLTRNLSIQELEFSLKGLIKMVQQSFYADEIKNLKNSEHISSKSQIQNLDPFLGDNDLLRVGGRLRKAPIEIERKFPIILPPKNNLTRLIILHEHYKQLHAGPLAILATLRQRYWPVQGRREIRSALTRCFVCVRHKPIPCYQKMGDLPLDRVSPTRPFYVCGTDFAGPFFIKDGKLRNRAIIKAYMCIFICLSTKAVHIEAVSDMSSATFLNCLKRFISRRGLCKRIYSDNGKNYVGANNKLVEIQNFLRSASADNLLSKFCDDNRISWKFIPAFSPHHGGIWEAAIKSAKYHATRIIGNSTLTFEGISTIFAQIESVLNSRPLTEISSNPDDLDPLTPGHFLIGSPLNAIPECDVQEIPVNRLSQNEVLQQMFQHFWTRWKHEYLVNLQKRTKWCATGPNLEVGSLVVLKEDTAPLLWKLGRVIETHAGEDGIVRVVSVKTSLGTVKRAVQKVCLLPTNK